MSFSSTQRISISITIFNTFLLFCTLTAFTLFVRSLLNKNLDTDLEVEAEEIVTQHLTLDQKRITYTSDTSNQTLEQDLLTDRLSSMLINKDGESMGKFGVFAKTNVPQPIDQMIRDSAKKHCDEQKAVFQREQYIQNDEYTYYFYPIISQKVCYGTIVVAGSTHTIVEVSRLILAISAAAVLIATVLNFFLGKTLAKGALTPLQHLAKKMRAVDLNKPPEEVESPFTKNDEITELIDTFNTMAQRVHETASTQKSFIIDASHELKTPIARAVTELDMLKLSLHEKKSPKELSATIDQAQNDLKSIADIVNTLLQAAKLKQSALDYKSLSLAKLFEDEITALQAHFPEKQLQVTSTIGKEKVFADNQVITLILRNCLVNSFKYNVPHGKLAIGLDTIGNTYTLTISNTTQRYSDKQAKTESYKLGFNIIRNLCEITNYEFSSESEEGYYTVTIANIPISRT